MLEKAELDILSVMYEGDRNRDASDKIRGFLFQDYIAIMCILQEHVEYVCSEYLEDVDVFFDDGRFEFIQVKYYPKTAPNMKGISTDLYYQYLRLQMLQSTLKTVPSLRIYTEIRVNKPTLDEMKTYIKGDSTLPKSLTYPSYSDPVVWLRSKVYTAGTKEEQKKTFFSEMASENSLDTFLKEYQISNEVDINQYKENVMKALAKAYPNSDKNDDEEHWQLILLGLSISYVQQRYMLVNPSFEQLRIEKKQFDLYLREFTRTKTEQTIASYLVGIVCREHGDIIHDNEKSLSDLQAYMLDLICRNTIQWIDEIGKTVEGQYQLINTLSTKDANGIAGYKKKDIEGRLVDIAECYENFVTFLDYLWKIMLNICQEKIHNKTEISDHTELFNPAHYIVSSVTDYVCLDFPEDKYVRHSVILPRAGRKFNGIKRKIVERMVNLSPKPEKWYFENNELMYGKNYYRYSTANVNESPTVVDLGEDSFYIECLQCIKIDSNKWCIQETCADCIFAEKCVNEGT